ncbi:hypothetical protein RB595_002292 [Gaeumannomyces hyphopodioides]
MADTTSPEQQERWRLVVVPLFVVMTVGLLALGVTMMRRRYGLGGYGFGPGGPHDYHAHYHGRGSNLDPSYYNSYRRPGAGVPMTGRRRRGGDGNHPYAGLGDGAAADLEAGGRGRQQAGANGYYGPRRREEGLNELGEAPPPYAGAGEGKKGGEGEGPGPGPAADGGSGVEMSSPAREAPPGGGTLAPPAAAPLAAAASSSPPAYSEARRG